MTFATKSALNDRPPFFGTTVANGAFRTLLDLQLCPAQSLMDPERSFKAPHGPTTKC
jgi:hypothetical protein